LRLSADESFELGLKFELVMEVRPRVASGVLLHVRTAEGFFTMYIHGGAVSPHVCPEHARSRYKTLFLSFIS